ncbi:hypothetical protein [Lapidilactobacillus achengensis]|uniref:hypothetical protein n=1 Tax=Lapidilactobacillus achengensis TaxID=2486000 RepID=UPI0036D2140C
MSKEPSEVGQPMQRAHLTNPNSLVLAPTWINVNNELRQFLGREIPEQSAISELSALFMRYFLLK